MSQNNNFNDLDLNDPMVQKCLAYLKTQLNNNQMNNMNNMNNNMNNMYMNQMNNNMNMNQMNNNMNMNQMNNNYINNNNMNMNNANMVNNNINMNLMNNNMSNNPMYYNNNPMLMNQFYNNPMFMGMNPMQMQTIFNYYMRQNQNNPMNVMPPNNNIGGNNQNPNNNPNNFIPIRSNSENKLKEYLPRDDKTLYYSSKNINMGDNIINIALNASTGLKVIIPISINSTLEELFKKYAEKVSIPINVLGNKIVFLFSGGKIDPFSKEKIGDHFKNGAIITVFDQGGIIGA